MGLVEGLTATVDGLDKLMSEAGALLPALLRLIGADRDTSRAALTALINLCQAYSLPPVLLRVCGACCYAMQLLLPQWEKAV